jgi:ribosomal biogenesis protein LAS1
MLRIVPWSCREEWLQTYQNLYNFDNTEQQIKGLERVDVWKSRSGSKLPLAVEVTASLITAGVEDVTSHVTPYVARHTMAMAIVRFVNGMVDMEQKGAYARSVQSIADEIGLPDWLVDLRHEATHASLPSLEVLKAGCKFALDWLRDRYWESQIAEFNKRDEDLVDLLRKYAKLCENFKSAKKTGKNDKYKKLVQEIADLVGKYNMW